MEEHPFPQQGQFELFKPLSPNPLPAGKRTLSFRSLTVSLDNLIIAGIMLIMGVVFFFSLGVEQGKRLGQTSVASEKKSIQNNGNSVSLQTSVEDTAIFLPADDQSVKDAASVAAPATGVAETAPTPDEGFTIQVASYKGTKQARQIVEQLQKLGHESFFVSKGKYVIVCVGRFAQKEEARKYSADLKQKYKDCLVRRL